MMKRNPYYRIVIALILMILLANCGLYYAKGHPIGRFNSGQTKSEIVQEFGNPANKTISDNLEMWTYYFMPSFGKYISVSTLYGHGDYVSLSLIFDKAGKVIDYIYTQ